MFYREQFPLFRLRGDGRVTLYGLAGVVGVAGGRGGRTFSEVSPRERGRVLRATVRRFSSGKCGGTGVGVVSGGTNVDVNLVCGCFTAGRSLFLAYVSGKVILLHRALRRVVGDRSGLLAGTRGIVHTDYRLSERCGGCVGLCGRVATRGSNRHTITFTERVRDRADEVCVATVTRTLTYNSIHRSLSPELFTFFLSGLLAVLRFSCAYTCCGRHLDVCANIGVSRTGSSRVITRLLGFLRSTFAFAGWWGGQGHGSYQRTNFTTGSR